MTASNNHAQVARADSHAPGQVTDFLEIAEAAAPATPASNVARLFLDTSDGLLKWKDDGGTVRTIGVGLADPMTTRGDILIRDASNSTARLGVGSAGQVLTTDGTDVSWEDPSASAGAALYPFDTNYFAETKPGSPNATYDDEFDDDTGMSGSGNGLNARWNWRNQSTATATFAKPGWLTLSVPSQGSANWRILEIAALADGTYDTRISIETTGASGDGGGGLVLVDGTNGDLYVFDLVDTSGAFAILLQAWTSVSAFGSSVASRSSEHVNFAFLRITKSGTTLGFWYSFDGIGFFRLASLTDTVGATRIGFGAYETKNTGLTKMHVDYFRKTA